MRPGAALSYLNASCDALRSHAEHVHMGRAKMAMAEVSGVGGRVSLYYALL